MTRCKYDTYICTECGYFENYIQENDIREHKVFENGPKNGIKWAGKRCWLFWRCVK